MPEQQESPKTAFLKGQEEFSSIFTLGLDKITEFQKTMLDTYARQTVSALRSMRYVMPMMPSFLFDTAEQGIHDFAKMQTHILDLLAKETREYMNTIKQSSSQGIEETSRMATETADRFARTQKKGIDIAAKNVEDYTDEMKRHFTELPRSSGGEEKPRRDDKPTKKE